MDIYRERVNTVEFEAPTTDTTVTAEYSYNGGTATPLDVSVSTTEPEMRNATLPYLPDEGRVDVTWKFTLNGTEYTKTQTYNVVTPLLSPRWIKKNLMEGYSDSEIFEAEAAARYIVQAHTGQSFGLMEATKTVYGSGGKALALPARLASVESVNGVATGAKYAITGDGWYLTHGNFGIPPVKADYYGLHIINGVIENPYGVNLTAFREGARFEVAGTWGWENVPEPVTEAMKLLVNDYASGDIMYRDRYLVSMTAADWRIQFTNGAFAKTGNVRADQLLSEYVLKRGWAVI